jgi:hypothetical protein
MWSRALLTVLLAAKTAPGADDPLLDLLVQDQDAARRGAIQDLVRADGGDGCATLSGYARARDARARENAVRMMGEVGCSSIDAYRPFFSDGTAWIADALLNALARNRVEEGVPYALALLSDRRRLVTDDGSRTLGQEAQRALRTLTGQPILSAAPQSPGDRRAPIEEAWRAWYAAHENEPATVWIASGVRSMREALAANSAARRLDALETALLIGEPGRPLLSEALRRNPSDLTAVLSCIPEEPPRVTDQVPCTLTVRNASPRRIALAPGDTSVALSPWEQPPPAPKLSGRSRDAASERSKPKGKTDDRDSPPPVGPPPPDPRTLGGRLVDLAPGEILMRPVQVGPVLSAGRYEVKVGLADLWARLDPGPYSAPPIEAAFVLRFEQ